MKRVLLIINPKSGKSKSKSKFFEIIETLSKNGCVVTTRITAKSGDATDFACEACLCGAYDLIVCCGGDGTLSETISGIIKSGQGLPFGYIPCGSTNDYAKSLCIPSDFKEAAYRAATGSENEVDIGEFCGRHFNYIASFGLFTAVSYNASRSLKSLLGHLAYVLEGSKELTKIKSYHVRVETDSGAVYEDDYLIGAIANSTSIGGVVKLKETLVSFNDGVFEVCLVKKPKNPADLIKIAKGIMASDFTSDCFEFFRASSLDVKAPSNMSWSLDGEKATPGGDVKVNILHSAVKLIL